MIVHKKPGYILILTIMVIALSVFLVTYITNKSMAYSPVARAMVDREKAMMLALSGVQLAMSQLAGEQAQKETKTPAPGQQASPQQAGSAEKSADVALLKTILPVMNRWQTFALKKATDGIDGTIQLCLMSEDGKIDLNALYDFQNQQFVRVGAVDAKQALQVVFSAIEKVLGGKDLFQAFEKFLKDRQYKLHDVTELLTIKEFELFKRNVWYEPLDEKEPQEKKEKQSIYLTDIFTVWSDDPRVEPWLLSDSLCALAGLKRAYNKRDQEQIATVLKQFKPQAQWQTDWDTLLAPLYGKTYKELKGIEQFFRTTFDPKIFSVLSYGKIGKVTQKIVAIIERGEVSKDGIHDVTIKKLYWL